MSHKTYITFKFDQAVNIDSFPLLKRKRDTKMVDVVGAGFGRTSTMSLKKALEVLGKERESLIFRINDTIILCDSN